jgi:cobalamin biosynthesis Mg chelatase CobN
MANKSYNDTEYHEFLGLGNTGFGQAINNLFTSSGKKQEKSIEQQMIAENQAAQNNSNPGPTTFTDTSIYAMDASGNIVALPPGSFIPTGYTQVDSSGNPVSSGSQANNNASNAASNNDNGDFAGGISQNVLGSVSPNIKWGTLPDINTATGSNQATQSKDQSQSKATPTAHDYSWVLYGVCAIAIIGGVYWAHKKGHLGKITNKLKK